MAARANSPGDKVLYIHVEAHRDVELDAGLGPLLRLRGHGVSDVQGLRLAVGHAIAAVRERDLYGGESREGALRVSACGSAAVVVKRTSSLC